MNAWECGKKKVEVVFQELWTPRVRTPKRRITYELRYIGKSTDHCIFFIGARRRGDNYTRTALDLRNLVYSAQAPSAACSNSSNTLTSPKHCVFLSLAKQYLGTLQIFVVLYVTYVKCIVLIILYSLFYVSRLFTVLH